MEITRFWSVPYFNPHSSQYLFSACYKICQVENELLPYASSTTIDIYSRDTENVPVIHHSFDMTERDTTYFQRLKWLAK